MGSRGHLAKVGVEGWGNIFWGWSSKLNLTISKAWGGVIWLGRQMTRLQLFSAITPGQVAYLKKKIKQGWTQHLYFTNVKVLVTQLCPTLCDLMDCSPPSISVHGILLARILEWLAIPFSRESSQPTMKSRSPAMQADSLPSEPPRKPHISLNNTFNAVSLSFLGEGNGSPLQYSCLENSTDRGAWRAKAYGVAKSWTRLND